jgi:hypothetical protein
MIGYESLNLVGRYCLPNLNALLDSIPDNVPHLSRENLDNIILDFGVDDV